MTRLQVFSAVILRRFPEVMPQKDLIQAKVQRIFDAHEASLSRYSVHELEHLNNIRCKENELEIPGGITAQDKEDKWTKEKSLFKFADHDDRFTQTNYLFVQSKFGTDIKNQWLMPQTTFDRTLDDKNLIDTARRAIKTSLNIVNGYKIVTKLPSSVCTFKYPRKVREMVGYDGAAVFYLKAQLDGPNEEVMKALSDENNERLKWMTLSQARELVEKKYFAAFAKGLMHEDRVDVDKVISQALKYANTVNKISVNSQQ